MIRRSRTEIASASAGDDAADAGPSPEDVVVTAETHAAVRAAAGALTGRRRLLVDVLFYQPPQSYEEVSRRTGMPIGSIGPTRRRTLKELHQLLRAGGPSAPRRRWPDRWHAIASLVWARKTSPGSGGGRGSSPCSPTPSARPARGRASAVLVAGDGGVGKTRLAEELARHARRERGGGAHRQRGRHRRRPAVLAGAVRDPQRGARRTRHRRRRAAAAVARAPAAGGRCRPDAGPPVVLLDLLYQLVVDLAERRPVLLVVDDLQWADRSTRDLVAYLVANLVREPVLVLVTFRTDSPRRAPDLDVALAELRRLRKVATLDLSHCRVTCWRRWWRSGRRTGPSSRRWSGSARRATRSSPRRPSGPCSAATPTGCPARCARSC